MLREAAKTIRHISKMDVLTTSCSVRDGGISEYRASVRLYFEIEPARQHFDDGCVITGHEGWIEKPLGWIDAQVVRDVENVGDERAVDRVGLHPQVEITEGNGMSGGRAREREDRERGSDAQPFHGAQ